MSRIHIYRPHVAEKSAHVAECLDCKKRTRMLSFFTPYHGWQSTCILCGRKWCDGEWMDLPFVRGSRQKSIDAAKWMFRTTNINENIK